MRCDFLSDCSIYVNTFEFILVVQLDLSIGNLINEIDVCSSEIMHCKVFVSISYCTSDTAKRVRSSHLIASVSLFLILFVISF